MKLWTEGADGKLSVAATYVGHTSYVTAVAYVAPGASSQWPKGALVTGAPARGALAWPRTCRVRLLLRRQPTTLLLCANSYIE